MPSAASAACRRFAGRSIQYIQPLDLNQRPFDFLPLQFATGADGEHARGALEAFYWARPSQCTMTGGARSIVSKAVPLAAATNRWCGPHSSDANGTLTPYSSRARK